MEFTTRQLRAFHLVAEHLALRPRGAGALHHAFPASVLVRELETQLGYRLFDRTTRSVRLTRHGSDLLDATRRYLEELDEAMARVGAGARGNVRS